jgi:hypothetical protein
VRLLSNLGLAGLVIKRTPESGHWQRHGALGPGPPAKAAGATVPRAVTPAVAGACGNPPGSGARPRGSGSPAWESLPATQRARARHAGHGIMVAGAPGRGCH